MILAKTTLSENTLPEQVAFVLKQAVTALKAAAQDGSEVAGAGLAEVERCAGYVGLVLDVEVYADREEELQALFAELAAEDGADDELPPIIQDEGLEEDYWGEAA